MFLDAADRIKIPTTFVEKDFWVCWALNALYRKRPDAAPRLLFKGGISLSKAYGLINRFSEDVDITVFRHDLNKAVSTTELKSMSKSRRRTEIEAIECACQSYIRDHLLGFMRAQLNEDSNGAGSVEIDQSDIALPTLVVKYPGLFEPDNDYISSAVKIAFGAKSALEPNRLAPVNPYIADELGDFNFKITDITTIDAARTFWDKVLIVHDLRYRFERIETLKLEKNAWRGIITTCIACSTRKQAKRLFTTVICAAIEFSTHQFSFAVVQSGQPNPAVSRSCRVATVDWLNRDYDETRRLIIGTPPEMEEILASIEEIERSVNALPEADS